MAKILSLANQKGGVGKTTTAVNLAAALAEAGQRTLLVDIDPQANATSSLGFDKRAYVHQSRDSVAVQPVSQHFRDDTVRDAEVHYAAAPHPRDALRLRHMLDAAARPVA